MKPFYKTFFLYVWWAFVTVNGIIHRRRTFAMLNLKDSDGNYMAV